MTDWPQWTVACTSAFALVMNLYGDGQKQSVSGAVISILVCGFTNWVLYRGGFWTVWGITP